jgi:NAD(P)-dependent dehydrogenase (short-subunit alcohol dehydrogenase family)
MSTVGIVTGAGRGMGLECARRLTGTLDHLLLVDLDAASLESATEQLSTAGRTAVGSMVLDVTDRDGVAELATRAANLGTLRAVAHVAGISPTMADWRRIFTVDLVGTAILADALRPLATTGTAMVCFASMAAQMGNFAPDDTTAAILDDPLHEDFLERIHAAIGPALQHSGLAYAWAKYGVTRFVRHEAVRLGPVGARVCSVSPGIIATPQGEQEAANNPNMTEMLRAAPLGRGGRPEEVAAVVAFLLSEEASYLNGVDILVDGGICAGIAQAGPTG